MLQDVSEPQLSPWWLRAIRWPLRIIVLGFISNYLFGLLIAFFQEGWEGLKTNLTSWGLLTSIQQSHPLLFWPTLCILFTLVIASFIAEWHDQREKNRFAAFQQQKQEALLTHLNESVLETRAEMTLMQKTQDIPLPYPTIAPNKSFVEEQARQDYLAGVLQQCDFIRIPTAVENGKPLDALFLALQLEAVPSIAEERKKEARVAKDGLSALAQSEHHHMLVIGEPGAGKSTLLK